MEPRNGFINLNNTIYTFSDSDFIRIDELPVFYTSDDDICLSSGFGRMQRDGNLHFDNETNSEQEATEAPECSWEQMMNGISEG